MDDLSIERLNASVTKLVIGDPLNPIDVVEKFEEEGESFLSFKRIGSGQISIFAEKTRIAILESYGKGKGTHVRLHSKSPHFIGLGEKMGVVDKRGRKFEMFNSDNPIHFPDTDPLYISVPFFIVSSIKKPSFGIFLNSTSKTYFELRGDSYILSTDDEGMELYFIYGPSVVDVTKKFSRLTGRAELPPAWALGYQQSRWSYASEKEVMEIAERMRNDGIPCDVIYLDIDYMDGYRVFTWSKRFPDPKGMLSKLRKMGFKVVTIIDPGVKKEKGYNVYDAGANKDAFLKGKEDANFEGYVWPGKCVFPDFLKSKVRKWWALQHKSLFDVGVEGIWNDMNEPAVVWDDDKSEEIKKISKMEFDLCVLERLRSLLNQRRYEDEIVHTDDKGKVWKHSKVRNVYALLEAKATKDAFNEYKKGKRPFILSRAGFAGIQRYAAVWTGDNSSWWEHLENSISQVISLNMSGVGFCGADVGGFGSDCTPELLIRWTELGTFLPFFRNHSAIGTRRQEPWAFDKQTEEIVRRHIRRRYELFPHIYNLFYKMSTNGEPIIRPVLTCDQNDEDLYCVNDEFMLGESLLVAPVVRPNTSWRSVYLPKGKWFSFEGRKTYEGERLHKVQAPLEEIPVFVKENSVLFRTVPVNFLFEKEKMPVYVDIYGESGRELFYEDDGETYGYKDGIYNLYDISFSYSQNSYHVNVKKLHFSYTGRYDRLIFRFVTHQGMVKKIVLNGNVVRHVVEDGVPKIEVKFEDLK